MLIHVASVGDVQRTDVCGRRGQVTARRRVGRDGMLAVEEWKGAGNGGGPTEERDGRTLGTDDDWRAAVASESGIRARAPTSGGPGARRGVQRESTYCSTVRESVVPA